jgi:hypothetical protein
MTNYCGIECPCYGTLEEIHKALIGELCRLGEEVLINGWRYTVTEEGFQSTESKKEYSSSLLADALHTGTAILIGMIPDDTQPEEAAYLYEIATTGRIPHVSKRCALCGLQLCQDDQKYGACGPCRAEAVR